MVKLVTPLCKHEKCQFNRKIILNWYMASMIDFKLQLPFSYTHQSRKFLHGPSKFPQLDLLEERNYVSIHKYW